jgi:glutamate--cysteine ligase
MPRLDRLAAAGRQTLLKGGLKGLEKESLRITPSGRISQTPHPAELGSALKHPHITTDYSEALLELITPPFGDPQDALAFLDTLHRFVYRHIGEELLWAASMPCEIGGEDDIPIANYGSSNIGKMKHVYRRGLSWRYGRAMQAIAGIHYNYSVNEALWPVLQDFSGDRQTPRDFIAGQYFGLVRNVQRHGWLVPWLFGASPAFCRSFFSGREALAARFAEWDSATLSLPFATSLRMSDIGYRNDSQSGLDIAFDGLDGYVASLVKAIRTPFPPYEKIGVKADGEYRQLNANILQISNEYYSPIRPKQVARSCESPTMALKRRGVRYVELRSLDLGLAHPLGLDIGHMRFLELFLLCCLLRESPPLGEPEKAEIAHNALEVARRGREDGLRLRREGQDVALRDWARELAEDMRAVAGILDDGESEPAYQASLTPLADAIDDPETTPAAHVLAQMRETGESFQAYALRLSHRHAENFRSRPLDGAQADALAGQAERSLAEQRQTEAGDSLSFDEFLARYFAQVD